MWGKDYDNLARDYSHERWAEQPRQQVRIVERNVQEKPAVESSSVLVQVCSVVGAIMLLTYAVVTLRSSALSACNRELSAMHRLETQLIDKNNELRIEVEQLRGPDRIIGFAESKLGMSVARSNIYLKAGNVQNTGSAMAVANK